MGTVGSVTVAVKADSSQLKAEMVKNQAIVKEFAQTAVGAGQTAGGAMQNAAGSSIILSQGITGATGAARTLSTAASMLGTALRTAFPIFGALALLEVLEKLADNKFAQIGVNIGNGFLAMNLAAETSIDNLKLSTAKMQEQIDLLSGKRPNTLAEDLANAALAADKLASSLEADNRKIKELLQENSLGALSGMFTNRQGTADVAGTVNYFDQQMAHLAAVYQHAVRTGSPDADKDLKALNDKRADAMKWQSDQLEQKQRAQAERGTPTMKALLGFGDAERVGPNQDANIAILTGFGDTLANQSDLGADEKQNKATASKLKQMEDDKKYAAMQEEARRKAAAAAKAAQEAIIQQWRRDLDEQRTTFDNILLQEGQFWVQRMESAKKGSLSYVTALDEANKDIARMRAGNMRDQKEFDKTSAESYRPDSMDLSRGDTGAEKQGGRETAEWLKTMNDGISQRREVAEAIQEQSLQVDVLTGQISKLGEAQALAALHAQAFADAQERIDTALANAKSLPEGPDRKRTIEGLNNQSAQVTAQGHMQGIQDQQAIASQQLVPAMQQTLGRIAQDWTNMTQSIIQVTTQALNSFNEDITKAATGQGKASDFGHTFLAAGQGLFKGALQSFEGNVLKAFGLGGTKKPTGAQGDAFHVLIDQGGPGGSGFGPAGNALIRPFFGGQQGQQQGQGGQQPGGGSIWGNLLHAFLPGLGRGSGGASAGGGAGSGSDSDSDGGGFDDLFQGGFASGGDVLANRPAIVGERGPEMFVPRTAGRIVPNGQLGGGDTHMHFNIQSNDPAAVEAAIRRSAPSIMAATLQAHHSNSKRSPAGR